MLCGWERLSYHWEECPRQSQRLEGLVGRGEFRFHVNSDGRPFERFKQRMTPSDLHFEKVTGAATGRRKYRGGVGSRKTCHLCRRCLSRAITGDVEKSRQIL